MQANNVPLVVIYNLKYFLFLRFVLHRPCLTPLKVLPFTKIHKVIPSILTCLIAGTFYVS